MKKAIKPALLVFAILMLAAPGWGATKYGDADILKGKLIILREGRLLSYESEGEKVQINHQDVVRLGEDSSVVLSTVEKTTITLGSNALLHVKPWRRRNQRGFFKMLFGRMRAKISGLMGNERFNVKSATATIGVKGTEETILVNVQGDTVVGVSENAVGLRGLDGGELPIPEGAASGVVGGATPNVTFIFDPALFVNLDSVDLTTDLAIQVPLRQILIDKGVATKQQVERSERGAREGVELPVTAAAPFDDPGESALDEISEYVLDAVTEGGAPTIPFTIQFEK